MPLDPNDPVEKALAAANSREAAAGLEAATDPAGGFEALTTLLSAAAEAVAAEPSVERIAAWLMLRARTSGLEVEGFDEILAGLPARHAQLLESALETLPLAERARAQLALAEATSLDVEPAALTDARRARDEAAREAGLEAAGPVAALQFRGQGVVRVAPGRTSVTGTLSVTGPDGATSAFKVRTGGWGGKTYHERGGPLPPGSYTVVAQGRPTGRLVSGMTSPDGAASFWFLLKPDANTVVRLPTGAIRDGLCIHPDGNPPGTLGCLGLNESGASDNACRMTIEALRQAGAPVRLDARYDPGVLDAIV